VVVEKRSRKETERLSVSSFELKKGKSFLFFLKKKFRVRKLAGESQKDRRAPVRRPHPNFF
jgi:hypothetical protein